MADLINGLLGYMKDPRRSQQMQGLAGLLTSANDRARAFNQLNREATDEFLQTKDIYGPKAQQVANVLANAYNPVGMFIGPSSKMFNKDMALKASQMAKKGATPQEIWQTTGTVKGPDGQWRQEISDAGSTIVPQQKKALDWLSEPGPAEYPVGSINDLIQHQEVLKAYPDLANIRASLRKGESASYFPNDAFNERIIAPALVRQGQLANPQATRSSTLHELQHAIQQREQFASGGSADDFAFMRDQAMDSIKQLNVKMSDIAQKLDNKSLSEQEKQLLQTQYQQAMSERADLVPLATVDPMQAYGNLMGEAEARLTQRRMDLTPEQRKEFFPFEYTGETGYGLDVPLEGLIQMDAEGTIIQRGLLGNAPSESLSIKARQPMESLLDTSYRMTHTAPNREFGATLDDLTGGGQMYPADVYSPKGHQYYGTGSSYDKKAFDIANRFKGKPDATVEIYRAVPKGVSDEINPGDWVTLTKDYAEEHGQGPLKGDYKIIKKKVKASDIYTNADSIHEWGYDPQ